MVGFGVYILEGKVIFESLFACIVGVCVLSAKITVSQQYLTRGFEIQF
jgi:hypothetical protein